jgi:adenosine/AMP kinase
MGPEFECIPIEKDEDTSAILGHAGFIKTVEDLFEVMAGSVPGVRFGIAFAEARGASDRRLCFQLARQVGAPLPCQACENR